MVRAAIKRKDRLDHLGRKPGVVVRALAAHGARRYHNLAHRQAVDFKTGKQEARMPKALHFKRSELPFIPCKMPEGETKIARVINKEISHNMGGGLEIGEDVCIHWTTLYDEILFIHEGSMIVRTDQGEYECKAGDIVWLPEGVTLDYDMTGRKCELFLRALSLRLGGAQRHERTIRGRGFHQMIDLTGKIAFVTGGGRGIGAAIVRKIVQAGGSAVLHDVKTTGGASRSAKGIGRRSLPSCRRGSGAGWQRAGDLAAGAGLARQDRRAGQQCRHL